MAGVAGAVCEIDGDGTTRERAAINATARKHAPYFIVSDIFDVPLRRCKQPSRRHIVLESSGPRPLGPADATSGETHWTYNTEI